ncbi:EscU/YscU/HrcU family type III secretion system export apparatus switch protein [Stieleria sp. JC731]|uniref:EscU/YscU/HrcU family type III secretion system export apparatus switch protein n=1 Tax=Pirellulaceae TaxID=2691357 RepID=UPI001E4B0A61|nr:EscU/YscU/HrcU family type III secretion system export apparatus switch protein [Stieleria sp. JC731]MCC9599772.1 EscU/YscU/HrcU family type III secretion system export apparatus switch protein [Stieleria sp. JC731]
MSGKIHPPTPKKRQEAREQGRGPRSNELVSAATLLSATGLMSLIAPQLVRFLATTLEDTFNRPPELSIESGLVYSRIARLVLASGVVLLPLLIGLLLIGIASGLMQSKGKPAFAKLVPSFGRLSPAKRAASMLGMQAMLRTVVSTLKLIAILCVVVIFLRNSTPVIAGLGQLPIAIAGAKVFELLIGCAAWLGTTVMLFAIVDYAISWWQFERDLMMTDQELREEIRNSQRTMVPNAGVSNAARTTEISGVT